jgi:hypothetical protein
MRAFMILLASVICASAQPTPTLEELREAAELCWKHSKIPTVLDQRGISRQTGNAAVFDPGWEDCPDVTAAYVKAKALDTSADRQRLQDLKKRMGQ